LTEIYQKDAYLKDVEFFMKYMEFMKNTAIENSYFYDTNTTKDFMYNSIYQKAVNFITENSDIFGVGNLKIILENLIQVAFSSDKISEFDKVKNIKIYEINSLEIAYNLLSFYFKTNKISANSNLLNFVFLPIEISTNSLKNIYTLSHSIIINLLSIFKHISAIENKSKLVILLGNICSVNSNASQISKIMKNLGKIDGFTDLLINTISGDTIKSMFYFDGNERSFIKLQPPPQNSFISGILWNGNIRLEPTNSNLSTKGIWSLLYNTATECKGISLQIHDLKLVCKFTRQTKKEDQSIYINLADTIKFKENCWHAITTIISKNEICGYFDDTFFKIQIKDFVSLKNINIAVLGAELEFLTGHAVNFFCGEMSSQYFFSYSTKIKDSIKEIAFNNNFEKYFINEQVLNENENFFEFTEVQKKLKYLSSELRNSLIYKIDPIVFL